VDSTIEPAYTKKRKAMDKYYYGYDEFIRDIRELTLKASEFNPDTLLAVARGGLMPGHFMAEAMDTHRLFVLNSIHYDDTEKLQTLDIFNIPDLSDAKRVLIIDDIADSGETLEEIMKHLRRLYPHIRFKIATLFYKPSSVIQPDYTVKKAESWIDFLWTADTEQLRKKLKR